MIPQSCYSKKYKSLSLNKDFSDSSQHQRPNFKAKLQPLSPNQNFINRKNSIKLRLNQKRNSLFFSDDSAEEYESALCRHLGIHGKLTDMDQEETPLIKINAKTPKKFYYKSSILSAFEGNRPKSKIRLNEIDPKQSRDVKFSLPSSPQKPMFKLEKFRGSLERNIFASMTPFKN